MLLCCCVCAACSLSPEPGARSPLTAGKQLLAAMESSYIPGSTPVVSKSLSSIVIRDGVARLRIGSATGEIREGGPES